MPFNKILIVVDDTEFSVSTAKWGFAFAHQAGATVALIYVVDMSKAVGNVDAGILPQEALIVLKREAELCLDRLTASYATGNVVKFMPEGHPLKQIIVTAGIWGADLIVVGKHARSGLTRLLSGNITAKIVQRSEIPLIVVPAG